MRARRPAVWPVLTTQHRGARLAFARKHQNWQVRHCRPVLFTDESRFTLTACDRRERVWRHHESDIRHGTSFSMTGSAPVLVFPGQGQSGSTVLGSENRPNYRPPGPHSTLMESVSDSLVRISHASGPLEVSLKGPTHTPPGPHRRQTEKSVLMLGGGPLSALYGSPGLLASLF